MKEKSFGSNCVYPKIFRDYFLEAISESGYKDKVVYKDLDNISLCISCIKINMYSINMFLSNVFRHYKKVKFNVLQVKKVFHVNQYQLYTAKVSIDYKGSKWLMSINISNKLSKFPYLKKQLYSLPTLKKAISIYAFSKEDQIADLFYRIINNLNTNAIDLYQIYLLFYSNINISDLGIALENINKSIYETINCDYINKKITNLSSNRKVKEKWIIFKNINKDVNIEYEDIICCLYLILLKLKERLEKKP